MRRHSTISTFRRLRLPSIGGCSRSAHCRSRLLHSPCLHCRSRLSPRYCSISVFQSMGNHLIAPAVADWFVEWFARMPSGGRSNSSLSLRRGHKSSPSPSGYVRAATVGTWNKDDESSILYPNGMKMNQTLFETHNFTKGHNQYTFFIRSAKYGIMLFSC